MISDAQMAAMVEMLDQLRKRADSQHELLMTIIPVVQQIQETAKIEANKPATMMTVIVSRLFRTLRSRGLLSTHEIDEALSSVEADLTRIHPQLAIDCSDWMSTLKDLAAE